MAVASLAILVPLAAATIVAGLRAVTGRAVAEASAVLAALAVVVLCALLVGRAGGPLQVLWLGGWTPVHGLPVGIALTPDGLGSAMALFGAALTVAALLTSSRLRAAADPLFHVIVLVLLGAIVAFCISGDLFTMFVFFELMSVCAYALVALRSGDPLSLEGGVNFAITNSVGAIGLLLGTALLYGRTGALNLARIGEVLAGQGRPDALVVVAFTLIAGAFLVKAAVVPFHFWLSDAYAAASAPVCLLLAGAFTELGLFGIARVWWTVFEGPFGVHAGAFRVVFVVAGLATAVVGAVMALQQAHLRRMLAFLTTSTVGSYLVGFALLDHHALGGAALWVLADGLGKAALFVAAGVLEDRFGTVDLHRLHGLGRDMPIAAGAFVVCGLATASMPPLGPFWGKALVEHGAEALHGFGWLPWALAVPSALVGGAVLRAAAGIFGGWGAPPPEDPSSDDADDEEDEEDEDGGDRDWSRYSVLGVALVVLTLATAFAGVVRAVRDGAVAAAVQFADHRAYVGAVLHGTAAHASAPAAPHPSTLSWALGAGSTVAAVAVAAVALLPVERRRRWVPRAPYLAFERLRDLHSGHVGDYLLWLVVGMVCLGGTLLAVVT